MNPLATPTVKQQIDALRRRLSSRRGLAAAVGLADDLDLLLDILETLDLQTRAAVFGARVAMGDNDDAKAG